MITLSPTTRGIYTGRGLPIMTLGYWNTIVVPDIITDYGLKEVVEVNSKLIYKITLRSKIIEEEV